MGNSEGNLSTMGYRVLEVAPNSPASEAGLRDYTDFIVAINGTQITETEIPFQELVRSNKDYTVTFTIWSILDEQNRDVPVKLNDQWGGEGLLGTSIRFESMPQAAEKILHVVEVSEDSPASRAGLEVNNDFILGSEVGPYLDIDDFVYMASQLKPFNVCVYNMIQDKCRKVTVTPARDWGGAGVLGCNVADGVLHKISLFREEKA